MWWVYLDRSAVGLLETLNSSLLWGYGHYLIFSSIAAVGAGINVRIEYRRGGGAHPADRGGPGRVRTGRSVPRRRMGPAPAASAHSDRIGVVAGGGGAGAGAAVTGAPVQITAIIMVTLVVVTVATSRAGSASVTPVGRR